MEIPKRWKFVLNFDAKVFEVYDNGILSETNTFKRMICVYDLRRWLLESIDTPFLSQDSDYIVILGNETVLIDGFRKFVDFYTLID